MKKSLIIALLVMGASGIVGQILLLRELLITFHGNELSIGIILANWLILEAFGSFFLGKQAERLKRPIYGFVVFQIIFSISLPGAIYLSRVLIDIIGATVGEGLGLTTMLYSSFFILLPVSISHGALFTFGCKAYSLYYKQNATSIGRVYIYETFGTIVGGVAFTYLLITYFHSLQIVLGVSFVNFIICVFLLYPSLKETKLLSPKILVFLSLIFLLLTGFLTFGSGTDKIHWLSIRKQWKSQDVVHYQNSIYGNIVVIRRGEQYTFFSDGIPVITTPTPDITIMEEFVHLPMLSHPKPEEILVISGGVGGVINEILKHPVERIDYVELDPLLLEVIDKFHTTLTEAEINDKKVNIIYIDGRLFIKKTSNKYDVILSGLSNPSDLQINRLFTKEFFSLVKSRLKEGGIIVISLPGSLTYLSDELRNLNKCIINTLESIFPYIMIIPGDGINIFLASDSESISLIGDVKLTKRLNERNLDVALITPEHIEYKLHPRWLAWFLKSLEGGTEKINRDFKPLGLFYSISYWNALFAPSIRGLFNRFEKINLRQFIIAFFVFTILFLVICHKIKRLSWASIPFCIGTTGFAAMIFQLTLIFTFQVLYGYVFYWIGILVTAFMVGVAIGSLRMTLILKHIKNPFTLFIKLEIVIIIFSGILPLIFFTLSPYLDRPVVFILLQIVFLILSLISGVFVGAEFPLANKVYLKKDSKISGTAGLLYASDLLGGWIGGIIGGIILLPILGLLNTCIVVLVLKVSSLIILSTSTRWLT